MNFNDTQMICLKWNEKGKAPASAVQIPNKYLRHAFCSCAGRYWAACWNKGRSFTCRKLHSEVDDPHSQQRNDKKITGCDKPLNKI